MRANQDYAMYVALRCDRWIFWTTILGFNLGERCCCSATTAAAAVVSAFENGVRLLAQPPLTALCNAALLRAAVILILAIQSQMQPQPFAT